MMTEYNGLELWEKVCKTDPNMTKEVNFGRKFTAIDPHYQIKRMTEMFGPVGIGWGHYKTDVQHLPSDQICICVRVWIGSPDRFFEHMGQNGYYTNKERTIVDGEASKKAYTDGLTKAISHLGFCADVFEGKFEDSKYRASLEDEFSNTEPAEPPEPTQGQVDAEDARPAGERMNRDPVYYIEWFGNCPTVAALRLAYQCYKDVDHNNYNEAQQQLVDDSKDSFRNKLLEQKEAA